MVSIGGVCITIVLGNMCDEIWLRFGRKIYDPSNFFVFYLLNVKASEELFGVFLL